MRVSTVRPERLRGRRAVVGALAVGLAGAAAIAGGSAGATTRQAAAPRAPLAAADLAPAARQPVQDGSATDWVTAGKGVVKGGRTSIVVKLKGAPLASYRGGVKGLKATAPKGKGRHLSVRSRASVRYLSYLKRRQAGFIARTRAAVPSAKVTQRLSIVVNAVAVTVPVSDIARIAADPAVAAVYPDAVQQPQTETSPTFIGAPTVWNALGGQGSAGEGVIVGVLDTGIWPEHPSFSDPDPSGKAYAAPRPPLAGTRACDFGSATPGDVPFSCNDKLIGAARFMSTYAANVPLEPGEFRSARDDDGHGTHTASTSAGNGGVAASIFGTPRGTISGIAPRAQVIAYKVCGAQGCFSSDSAAAVQRAITDGVDVINFSISGGANPYTDVVSLAFLDAYNAGVFVAASAGNAGPGADTTDHREPWVATVAASTANRSFLGSTTLTSSDGASLTITGTTLTGSVATPSPVVASADPFCRTPAAAGTYTGQIVVCRRGGGPGRVQKGFNVLQGGAAGMILYNTDAGTTDQETDNHFLPAVQIQFSEGQQVLAFLSGHPDVTATISGGVATPSQGDVMASFSSRGGPGQSLGISKPDITAPGVQILAGHTPMSVDIATGPQGELFQAIAGTSMSSPHIAGSGALIKALHPSWTPGQIKSALMTTAQTNVVKEDGVTPTDAFDDGSGRVNLSRAGSPLFTFDETGANYVANRSALYKANYPSLYVPALSGALTVTRTLTSVASSTREIEVSVSSPADLRVRVSKDEFLLRPGASRTISITVDGRDVPIGQTRFATITFRSGRQRFTFPVTIVRRQGPVEITKSCTASVRVGGTVDCGISLTNTISADATVAVRDALPKSLRLVNGSVVGGTGRNDVVTSTVVIPGRRQPAVNVANVPLGTPAGYVPLSLFGAAPIGGVGDETITNFNVPAFTVAGVQYTRIGIVSDGYVVLGGGTGADISFANFRPLPDASRPNNIIAPFWTDLDPGSGGAVRIDALTDGVSTWLVIEFEDIPEFSTHANTHSFQIWLRTGTTEDATFVYGPNTGAGDGGITTVGVENPDGSQGQMVYFSNGGAPTGSLPVEGDEFVVTGTPGVTSTANVTFSALARRAGGFVNYAEATGDVFDGIAIARAAGTITP